MFTFSSAQLSTWVAGLIFPLTRVLGLIAVAPVFGHTSVPIRAKIGLGVMVTLILMPILPAVPGLDPFSPGGVVTIGEQFLIGLAMGFAMRIVFAAVELAGELTALTMGLNFATFFDPQSQGQSSVISQFLTVLAILSLLTIDGHLLLLSALTESFTTLPIGSSSPYGPGFRQIADWGGTIFAAGIQLSLPMIAALLVTTAALGVLSRAAPQLNIFGVGFPVTLGVGLLALGFALPYMAAPLEQLLHMGLQMVRQASISPATPLAPP
jgi:flagellar biosynthetic protein FliR